MFTRTHWKNNHIKNEVSDLEYRNIIQRGAIVVSLNVPYYDALWWEVPKANIRDETSYTYFVTVVQWYRKMESLEYTFPRFLRKYIIVLIR